MLIMTGLIYSQSVTIKGKVTEKDTNEPMPGVNVSVKGSNTGTTANFDGYYTFKVDNAKGKQLLFSFVGFNDYVVTLDGSNQTINVQMKESNTKLNDVVITALGIKKEQKALGYAITKVKGENIAKSNTTSAVTALQGRVAGVNISSNSSGAAGSSRIIIRGASSLTGNNQPLYVVDGIPIINNTNGSVVGPFGGEHGDGGDDIADIDPNNIESISVLKGSSASALYGSLASNGVIMITTKSGKGKSFGVDFSSTVTFDKVNTSLFDLQTSYGQGRFGLKPGYEYDNITGQAVEIADPALATENALVNNLSSWGPAYDGSMVYNWDGEKRAYSYLGNNIDKFYQTGSTANTSLALYNSNKNFSYRLGFSNLSNEDIFPKSTIDRKTISLNTSAQINPKLKSTITAFYTFENVHNRATIGDTPGNANTTAWLLPGNVDITSMKSGYDNNGAELATDGSQFITNPYWAVNKFNNNDDKNRLFASTSLRYDFNDWLYFMGRAGIDTYVLDRKQVTPYGTEYRPAGVLTQLSRNNTQTNADLLVGINKKINNNLGINSLFGANTRYFVSKQLQAVGSNFIVPEIEDLNLTTLPVPTNSFRETQTNSLYGSIEADFNKSYFLTFTGRNDWFSTLSFPDKSSSNNEFYWSISSSILLNKILKTPKYIDFLKLRASYAQVAGGAQDPYRLNLNYSISGTFQGQALGTINGSQIPNANLIPYQKNEFEVGIDSKFFLNRLYVDLSYYNNSTTNDIVYTSASIPSGYSSAILNVGELSNKGVELLIGGTPIKKNKFSWKTSFNMGYNNSQIVSTDEFDTPINVDGSKTRSKNAIISHIVGEHYGVIYGTTYVRENGKIVYDLSGGVPKPVQGDPAVLGQGVAPLNLGFYNGFKYKNISFNFLIDGKFGGSVHSGTNLALLSNGLHKKTVEGRENGLTVSGIDQATGNEFSVVVPVKDIETYYGNIAAENLGIAEEFIYSTDFIKFRELSISYQVPNKYANKILLKKLSVSLIGRNLFYLYKKTENIDPESSLNNMNSQGIERFGMPATRSFGFSINAKL
jgi:TonB-linked SusC/RagA family outer membrane protein